MFKPKKQSSPSPITDRQDQLVPTEEPEQEEQKAPQDISFAPEGLGDIVTDILENKPQEMFEASDEARIKTKAGTFVYTAPPKFTQAIDPDDSIIGHYLSEEPGTPNEQVILMLVQPLGMGPDEYGLFSLGVGVKTTILKDQLKLGTNYQLVGKVKTENWRGLRRAVIEYTFDSQLLNESYRGREYLIFKDDKAADGLWVHIQMPQQVWDEVLPFMQEALETLRIEE